MRRFKLSVTLSAALAVLLLLALPAENVLAQAQPHALQAFGPLGLTPDQTLRLNFLPTDPCRVQLFFFDADGSVLADSGPLDLVAGHLTSLQLNAEDIGDLTGQHYQVRSLVQILSPGPTPGRSSLELLDSNQRTILALIPSDPCRALMPGQSPPLLLGPLNVAATQTLRFSVANIGSVSTPTDPCRVVLSFVNSAGIPIQSEGTSVQLDVTLAPGESAFLDLHYDGAITGVITFPSNSRALVASSLELYDTGTKATQAPWGRPACLLRRASSSPALKRRKVL